MIVGAVVVPSAPLLLSGMTGAATVSEVEQLRAAAIGAVRELVARVPQRLILVGGRRADETDAEPVDPAGRFAPAPGRPPARGVLSLAVGKALMAAAGVSTKGVELCAVPQQLPADRCLELGAALVLDPTRVGLIVVGDGSARRRTTSPGYLDERAIGFDESVETALAQGDLLALAELDAGLAAELLVAGRAAWQVMAGALRARPNGAAGTGDRPQFSGRIHCSADPFGVWYTVASLTAFPAVSAGE